MTGGLFSPAVQRLIDELAKLPGVGPKTAQRLTFYLLKLPPEEALPLAQAITAAKEAVRFCHRCFNLTEQDLCAICQDPRRDQSLLCVVEEPSDVLSLERTHEYRGLYHVLGGALSPLDGIGPDRLHLDTLFSRLSKEPVQELIIGTNPSLAGEATALFISEQLHSTLGGRLIRVTRLAAGLPVGGDLEYADEVTLGKALLGRREM